MTPISAIQGLVPASVFEFLQGLQTAARNAVLSVASAFDMAVGQKGFIDANAAATTSGIPFFRAESGSGNRKVNAIKVLTTLTAAANANDFATINVVKIRGGVNTIVGHIDTSVQPLLADTDYALSLDPLQIDLLPGDWLSLQVDKAGAGVIVGRLAVSASILPALRSSRPRAANPRRPVRRKAHGAFVFLLSGWLVRCQRPQKRHA